MECSLFLLPSYHPLRCRIAKNNEQPWKFGRPIIRVSKKIAIQIVDAIIPFGAKPTKPQIQDEIYITYVISTSFIVQDSIIITLLTRRIIVLVRTDIPSCKLFQRYRTPTRRTRRLRLWRNSGRKEIILRILQMLVHLDLE